ncbi:MAG: sulfotransferase, partial [Candidatus Nealsonbacteria bacterium]
MNTKNKIFFIIGNPRSGTNALAEILNTANNAQVFIEQEPKLRISSRLHYESVLPFPKEFIYKSKINKIKETIDNKKIYGDKNPNYLLFIEELNCLWQPKFIFVYRDGRDVVRSLIDFNRFRVPIYNRYEDNKKFLNVQIDENKDRKWDFSKLRPKKDDYLYNSWQGLSLFEKCSWSWAKFNELMLEKINRLEKDRYRLVNIDKITPKSIEQIFEFLGLEGFN